MSIVRDQMVEYALTAVEDLPDDEKSDALRELAEAINYQADFFAHPQTNPERCPVCGQPDNCGDCNHIPLTTEQSERLMAGEPPADFQPGRVFIVNIDASITCRRAFTEYHLTRLLGLTDGEVQAMSIFDVDGYVQDIYSEPEGNDLYEEMQKHSELQDSTINVELR